VLTCRLCYASQPEMQCMALCRAQRCRLICLGLLWALYGTVYVRCKQASVQCIVKHPVTG
jgi:hypothetical protein